MANGGDIPTTSTFFSAGANPFLAIQQSIEADKSRREQSKMNYVNALLAISRAENQRQESEMRKMLTQEQFEHARAIREHNKEQRAAADLARQQMSKEWQIRFVEPYQRAISQNRWGEALSISKIADVALAPDKSDDPQTALNKSQIRQQVIGVQGLMDFKDQNLSSPSVTANDLFRGSPELQEEFKGKTFSVFDLERLAKHDNKDVGIHAARRLMETGNEEEVGKLIGWIPDRDENGKFTPVKDNTEEGRELARLRDISASKGYPISFLKHQREISMELDKVQLKTGKLYLDKVRELTPEFGANAPAMAKGMLTENLAIDQQVGKWAMAKSNAEGRPISELSGEIADYRHTLNAERSRKYLSDLEKKRLSDDASERYDNIVAAELNEVDGVWTPQVFGDHTADELSSGAGATFQELGFFDALGTEATSQVRRLKDKIELVESGQEKGDIGELKEALAMWELLKMENTKTRLAVGKQDEARRVRSEERTFADVNRVKSLYDRARVKFDSNKYSKTRQGKAQQKYSKLLEIVKKMGEEKIESNKNEWMRALVFQLQDMDKSYMREEMKEYYKTVRDTPFVSPDNIPFNTTQPQFDEPPTVTQEINGIQYIGRNENGTFVPIKEAE